MSIIKKVLGTNIVVDGNPSGNLFTWGITRSSNAEISDLIANNVNYYGTLDFIASPVAVSGNQWKKIAPMYVKNSNTYVSTYAINLNNDLYAWGTYETDDADISAGVGYSWAQLAKTTDVTSHMAAIRSDGTLWVWGYNFYGQLGLNDTTNRSMPVQLGNESWSQVSVGLYHTTAIKSDGTLWTWGQNNYGQLGLQDTTPRSSPTQVGSDSSWTSVNAGQHTTVGTRFISFEGVGGVTGSYAFTWGDNTYGQLGQLDIVHRSSPTQLGTSAAITNLKTSGWTTGMIGSDMRLYIWGNNNYGQLGQADLLHRSSPTQIGGSLNLDDFYLSRSTSFYRDSALALNAVGYNISGALGLGDTVHRSSFTTVSSIAPLGEMYLAGSTTVALDSSGRAYIAGSLSNIGLNLSSNSSFAMVSPDTWSQFAVGGSGSNETTFGLRSDGKLYSASATATSSFNYNLGRSKPSYDPVNFYTKFSSTPVQVGTKKWRDVSASGNFVVAVNQQKQLCAWGINDFGQTGVYDTVTFTTEDASQNNLKYAPPGTVIDNTTAWKSVSAGKDFFIAVSEDGQMAATGAGAVGQIGVKGYLGDALSWSQISATTKHTLGITLDGRLYAWGRNSEYQLGTGTSISRSSPVLVGGVSNTWSKVATTTGYSTALKSTGELYHWGTTFDGTIVSTPTQLDSNNSYSDISAGETHILLISNTGTLKGYGYNNNGQLYYTENVSRIAAGWHTTQAISAANTLYIVGGDFSNSDFVNTGNSSAVVTTKKLVASNVYHTAASKSDGRHTGYVSMSYGVYMTGLNDYGQLGLGDTANRSSYVMISGSNSNTWGINTSLAIGGSHTAFIDSAGVMQLWGANDKGQLGQGDTAHRSTPTALSAPVGLTWSEVSLGRDYTLAIASDGSIYAWGANDRGQLGAGDLVHRSTPVQVTVSGEGASDAWLSIATSNNTSYGQFFDSGKGEYRIYAWGDNTYRQIGAKTGTNSYVTYPYVMSNIGTTGTTYPYSYYSLEAGGSFASVKYRSGAVYNTYVWGLDSYSNTIISTPTLVSSLSSNYNDSIKIAATHYIYGDAFYNKRVAGSGTSNFGELGVVSNTANVTSISGWEYPLHTSPVTIDGNTTWTSIAAGGNSFSLGVSGGKLYTWGLNTYGQLGRTTSNAAASAMTQVGTNTQWYAVRAGTNHAGGEIAVWSSGANTTTKYLYTWGYNNKGQLGDGTTSSRSAPTLISTSASFAGSNTGDAAYYRLALGGSQTAAPLNKTSGSWGMVGENNYGELGYGTTTNKSTFSVLRSSNNIYTTFFLGDDSSFYVGYNFSANNTSSLQAWGRNDNGQLGMADKINRSSPVLVGAITVSGTAHRSSLAAVGVDYQPWVTAAAGVSSAAAISNTGGVNTLYTWGYNTSGELGLGDTIHRSSPAQVTGVSNFSSVSLSNNYLIATSSNGWVYGAGLNAYGQLPYTNANFIYGASWVSVTSSANWGAGVKSDGSLWVWGDNTYGQLGLGDRLHRSSPSQVGTSSWTLVSACYQNLAAIRSDGTMWTTGTNSVGSLGDGTRISRSSPVQVSGAYNNWIDVACTRAPGAGSTLATFAGLHANGLIRAWGYGTDGQIGDGIRTHRSAPANVTGSYIKIVGGDNFFLGLSTAYTVYSWGNNMIGQLGDGTRTFRSTPTLITTFSRYVTDIAASGASGAAIEDNGTLWTWGDNLSGTLAQGDRVHRSIPTQVGSDTDWSTIDLAGQNIVAIKTDGTLWGTDFANNAIEQIGSANNWVSFPGKGGSFRKVNNANGRLYRFGSDQNNFGIGYDGTPGYITQFNTPTEAGTEYIPVTAGGSISSLQFVGIDKSKSWSYAKAGSDTLYLIDGSTGYLYGTGDNTYGQLAQEHYVGNTYSWTAVSSSRSHNLAVRSDGTLWAWGDNTWGQLGLQTSNTASTISPIQVATQAEYSGISWASVSAGSSWSYAITTDGRLFSWGSPNYMTGASSGGPVSSPVQFIGGSWTQVASSKDSVIFPVAAGIKSDGTLWGWGTNVQKWIVNEAPTSTNGLTIAGGALAITTDTAVYVIDSTSKLWAWGYNNTGELGQSDRVHRSVPTQIATTTAGSAASWSLISTRGGHTVGKAISGPSAGFMYAWGINTHGQLGDGTRSNRSTPTQIATCDSLAAGERTTFYTNSVGKLNSIGFNSNGELGDGTTIHRSTSVAIGTSSWVQIAAGYDFTMGITVDGKLFTWGAGASGQLGDGTTAPRSSPVQIGVGSSFSLISACYKTAAAIKTDGTLWTWGENDLGQLGQGDQVHRSSMTQVGTSSWSLVAVGKPIMGGVSGNVAYYWGLGNQAATSRSSPTAIGSGDLNLSLLAFASNTAVGVQPTMIGHDSFYNLIVGAGSVTNGKLLNDPGPASDISLEANTNLFARIAGERWVHRSSPVQIGTDSWTQVSAGDGYIAAIKQSDKGLYLVGKNHYYSNTVLADQTAANSLVTITSNTIYTGVLGQNDKVHRSVLTLVGSAGEKSWSYVSVSDSHVLAISNTGSLWTWGHTGNGAIGSGSSTGHRSSPAQVGSNTWSKVDAGPWVSVGIQSDNTVFVWGYNGASSRRSNTSSTGISTPALIYNSNGTAATGKEVSTTRSYVMVIDTNNILQGIGKKSFTGVAYDNAGSWVTSTPLYDYLYQVGGLTWPDTNPRSSPIQIGTGSWISVNDFKGANNFGTSLMPIRVTGIKRR